MLFLDSYQVWTELEKELFAVLGMVTSVGDSRGVGMTMMQMRDTTKARGRAPVA